MIHALALVLFVAAGLVNFAPVLGVFSADRLNALYGVALDDPNLIILMRHRAVLFGIVGGAMLYSVFDPSLRPAAVIAGFVSMVAFVVIALTTGDFNPELRRVLAIDLVAIALLVGAVVADRIGAA